VKLYGITPLGQRAADVLASGRYFQPQSGNRKFPKSRVHVPFPYRNLDPLSQQSDDRLQASNKNIAKTSKRLNCKHNDWPLQTFVHFLDMTALRNIYITQDYFTILTAYSETNENGWTGTICSDALVYLQHLKAKNTGRRKVKRVNDAVSIPTIQ
jgi:hypothetical protein